MTDFDKLAKLREPFPANQIGKLPKGGVMLDFIGHGYITQRFLDADPEWTWEPMAYDSDGLPKFDQHGGLWMWLTIGGVRRPGYGGPSNAAVNAIKESIGDGLRNAGMRFGAGLELWCKGDPDADSHERSSEPVYTPADKARDDLLALVKAKGLEPKAIQARFVKDYQKPIQEAGADVIEGFTRILMEEAANV